MLEAAKLKVDPGAAAVVVVAPKPPNVPVERAKRDIDVDEQREIKRVKALTL